MHKHDRQRASVIARLTSNPKSLRSLIDAKCCECIYDPIDKGTWRQQVEACTSPSCPLFPARPVSSSGGNSLGSMEYLNRAVAEHQPNDLADSEA